MKGPKSLKQYVALHRKHLNAIHWDDLFIFKSEQCKNWFKRSAVKQDTRQQINLAGKE